MLALRDSLEEGMYLLHSHVLPKQHLLVEIDNSHCYTKFDSLIFAMPRKLKQVGG